jgi:hypothetical protein
VGLVAALAVGAVYVIARHLRARQFRSPDVGKEIKDFTHPIYSAGQVWQYETRPGEEDSTFVIGRVAYYSQIGCVVHISVRGLQITPRGGQGPAMEIISHVPIADKAVDRSIVSLVGREEQVPGFEQAYAEWKREFRAGRAGVFTLSVAEVIGVCQEALLRGSRVDEDRSG